MKYICKIQCRINNRVYIGQTNNATRRKQEHFSDLVRNQHYNPALQLEFNKFGKSSFSFEVIKCVTDEEADEVEDNYIDSYGGIESSNLYNMQSNKTTNTEVRSKISRNLLGKMVGCKNAMYGVHDNHLGDRMQDEIRYTISKTKSRSADKYTNSSNVTKHLKYTQEFIDKLRSDKLSGLTYSDLEHKYNINHSTICNLVNYGTCNPKRDKM